jgi:hypothetical protein
MMKYNMCALQSSACNQHMPIEKRDFLLTDKSSK